MRTLILVAVVTLAVVGCYVLWLRDWLLKRPWAQPFFAWIEPYEIVLFKKSRTIAFARLKIFVGLLLTALTQTQAIDITPLMPLVPDQWEKFVQVGWNLLPMVITVVGMMDEKLRNATTQPVEVVAIPEAAMTPEVVEAVKAAEDSHEVAVQVAAAETEKKEQPADV